MKDVQIWTAVNSHITDIYLNAGLAKIEEAERRKEENQEFQNNENILNKQGQQWFYIFDVGIAAGYGRNYKPQIFSKEAIHGIKFSNLFF